MKSALPIPMADNEYLTVAGAAAAGAANPRPSTVTAGMTVHARMRVMLAGGYGGTPICCATVTDGLRPRGSTKNMVFVREAHQ
ncbi:Uncharacterised protein [Mycobacteroides abscessus subsp. abscessus]|nr:Uncharacterised protein [Mycobacteroides abscessus subsp. abscessus]